MDNLQWRECPFCGTPAKTKAYGVDDGWFRVECGGEFTSCVFMNTVNEPGAIRILNERWNSRAYDAERASLVNTIIDMSDEI